MPLLQALTGSTPSDTATVSIPNAQTTAGSTLIVAATAYNAGGQQLFISSISGGSWAQRIDNPTAGVPADQAIWDQQNAPQIGANSIVVTYSHTAGVCWAFYELTAPSTSFQAAVTTGPPGQNLVVDSPFGIGIPPLSSYLTWSLMPGVLPGGLRVGVYGTANSTAPWQSIDPLWSAVPLATSGGSTATMLVGTYLGPLLSGVAHPPFNVTTSPAAFPHVLAIAADYSGSAVVGSTVMAGSQVPLLTTPR